MIFDSDPNYFSNASPHMTALEQIRRLWAHATWADAEVLAALRAAASPPPEAVREYAHVLGAAEVWLSRLEQRAPRAPLWPTFQLAEAAAFAETLRDDYRAFIDTLDESDLERSLPYTNSAGLSFITPIGDMLMQVVTHGQYHRGKVNVLLRQSGHEPAPVDYIAFARGVSAATTPR